MSRRVLVLLALVAVLALVGCSTVPSAAALKAPCFANESAVETEMRLFKADSGLDAPLSDVIDKMHIVCPAHGVYSYDPATGHVNCSVHGHS